MTHHLPRPPVLRQALLRFQSSSSGFKSLGFQAHLVKLTLPLGKALADYLAGSIAAIAKNPGGLPEADAVPDFS